MINEDNTFHITEHITAYYNSEKHGVYRTIPSRNKISRQDGVAVTKLKEYDEIDSYKKQFFESLFEKPGNHPKKEIITVSLP